MEAQSINPFPPGSFYATTARMEAGVRMTTYKYRDIARPQFDALKDARDGFEPSHPVFRCAQIISHLSYRGPHQAVGWYANTRPADLPTWASDLGIIEGMPLRAAMSTALSGIRSELSRARTQGRDAFIDSVMVVVGELEAALDLAEGPALDNRPEVE